MYTLLSLYAQQQLYICADDNLFGRSINTIQNNAEIPLGNSKGIGLDINIDKINMSISQNQDLQWSHNVTIVYKHKNDLKMHLTSNEIMMKLGEE